MLPCSVLQRQKYRPDPGLSKLRMRRRLSRQPLSCGASGFVVRNVVQFMRRYCIEDLHIIVDTMARTVPIEHHQGKRR